MFDLIVIGGGISGVSAAISAARNGANVLIIEQNSFLGGSSTGALVTPMMRNMLNDNTHLTEGFFQELMGKMRETKDSAIFKDGNIGWFNPESLKCILDDFCEEEKIEILFNTILTSVKTANNKIQEVEVQTDGIKQTLSAKYFIDATGNGDLAFLSGNDFESGIDGQNQAMTLRFNLSGVNVEKFASFLEEIDPNSEISPVYRLENGEIMLSTAYTWEDKGWKLKPYFDEAIKNNDLKLEDSAYFQLFSIPNAKSSLTLNCPRISSEKPLDPLNPKDISYALIQGRKQIRRLANFCKNYLPGFEDSFISQIASMLGIRDSRRIKCKYQLTEEDIINAKKFKNPVFKSNYPIDVHSLKQNEDLLKFIDENHYYEFPLEAMLSGQFENLIITGRCVSATFLAQASLRIIPNCIAMGEYAGKYVALKNQSN